MEVGMGVTCVTKWRDDLIEKPEGRQFDKPRASVGG
jgi:hypothetical protein